MEEFRRGDSHSGPGTGRVQIRRLPFSSRKGKSSDEVNTIQFQVMEEFRLGDSHHFQVTTESDEEATMKFKVAENYKN
jgi:hypothetical protein